MTPIPTPTAAGAGPLQPTARQREIYDYIVRHVEEHGCQPSYKDIMRQFAIGSPHAVWQHLAALQRKGLIAMPPGGGARCLKLVGLTFRAVRADAAPADRQEEGR